MKKLALSTLVLLGFSLSILIFQASCKKEAKAETEVNDENSGIILIGKRDENNIMTLYSSNYDGSNIKKINIPINADIEEVFLSPDKKTIFFSVHPSADTYKCSIDGSNLVKLFDHSTTGYYLEGAY